MVMERWIALILAGLLYFSAAVFIVDTKVFHGKLVSDGLRLRVGTR